MKISKLFHWLYASVMFLPLLAIPVFMIYSHRHTLTERTNVEINYKYQTNEVNSVDDLVPNNLYQFDLFGFTQADEYVEEGAEFSINVYSFSRFDIDYNDSYVDEIFAYQKLDLYTSWYFTNDSITFSVGDVEYYTAWVYEGFDFAVYDLVFSVSDAGVDFDNFIYFLNEYYDELPNATEYNVIESVNADTTNENVMNVFFKDFGDFTDKYFNFDNVLSLHSITEWIDINVFNGVTPLGFTIVWRYLEYWLIVSIFWLCFDVLIYVPQIAHRWLDKASLE